MSMHTPCRAQTTRSMTSDGGLCSTGVLWSTRGVLISVLDLQNVAARWRLLLRRAHWVTQACQCGMKFCSQTGLNRVRRHRVVLVSRTNHDPLCSEAESDLDSDMIRSLKYLTFVTFNVLVFSTFCTFAKGSPDPYRVLGVSRSASSTELKQAYKRLALLHHPDKVGFINLRYPDD